MSDYIPPELITNILSRLTVDDAVRCTSLCKSWYELITSPFFASLHLNNSSSNQEPRMLVQYCKPEDSRKRYYLHRDNQSFDEVSKLDYPCPRSYTEIDCINGLYCFFNVQEGTIMLWNPSLRKCRVLPKPWALSDSQGYYKPTIGFGFVATSNEYKILSISSDRFATQSGIAEIYELSTDSWRDLTFEDYSDVNINVNINYRQGRQAHLNGIVHWCKNIPDLGKATYSTCICSFDMKDEKFGALAVPSGIAYFDPSTFRDSLSLIDLTRFDNVFIIWVLKEYGVADSWEKLFTVDIGQPNLTIFPRFRHNGEILFGKYIEVTEPRKLQLVSYNCDNEQVKNLGVVVQRLGFCPAYSAHPYVETLVLLKASNVVKIDEESTNFFKSACIILLMFVSFLSIICDE